MLVGTSKFITMFAKIVLVGKTLCSYDQNRKGRMVLTRCRTSHGEFTHSYLLARLFVLTVKIARIGWSWQDVVLVMEDLLIFIYWQDSLFLQSKSQRRRASYGGFTKTYVKLLRKCYWISSKYYTGNNLSNVLTNVVRDTLLKFVKVIKSYIII